MAQQLANPTSIHEDGVQSLAFLSGLRIRRCRELWCRSQMRFGCRVAVAVAYAGGYSSSQTPSLGTSVCHSGALKDKKRKKKKKLTKDRLTWSSRVNAARLALMKTQVGSPALLSG